jgi:hypothetical protein
MTGSRKDYTISLLLVVVLGNNPLRHDPLSGVIKSVQIVIVKLNEILMYLRSNPWWRNRKIPC